MRFVGKEKYHRRVTDIHHTRAAARYDETQQPIFCFNFRYLGKNALCLIIIGDTLAFDTTKPADRPRFELQLTGQVLVYLLDYEWSHHITGYNDRQQRKEYYHHYQEARSETDQNA